MELLTAFISGTLEDLYAFVFMVILTLAIVVLVHEWGHYLVARIFGVHVEEFAFGFGKEIVGFGGKGKTRFSVRAFPLGGFVKLFGDADPNNPNIWDKEKEYVRPLTDEEKEISYCTKAAWKRFLIVAAGPSINVLLTLIIMISVFTIYGQKSHPNIINMIAVDSASDKAGIKIGDIIVAMDGKRNRRIEDVHSLTWREDPAVPHTYTILRNGEMLDITYTAKRLEYENVKGVELRHGQTGMLNLTSVSLVNDVLSINDKNVKGQLDKARELIIKNFDKEIIISIESYRKGEKGTGNPFITKFPAAYNAHIADPDHQQYNSANISDPDKKLLVKLPIIEAIRNSVVLLKDAVVNSCKALQATFKGKNDDPVVAGVGKISESVGNAVKAGAYDYVMMIAIFSFMIAVINILPIPALDGGHLVFLTYEIIRGKALSAQIQAIATTVGLVILLGIMVLANISDFLSFISNVSSD